MKGLPTSPGRRLNAWVYLLATLGVFSAIPVAVLGNLVAERQVDDAKETFDIRGRRLAENVVTAGIQLLQTKAEVLGVIAGTVETLDDPTPARLQEVLESQFDASGSFDAIYISDALGVSNAIAPSRAGSGRRLQAGVDYSDRDYFIEAHETHGVAFSQVQLGRQSGVANIMIGAPFFFADGPEVRGVSFAGLVAGGVRLDLIEASAKRLVEETSGSRVVILDGRGSVLVDTNHRVPALEALAEGSVFGTECGLPALVGPDEAGREVRAVCAPLEIGSQRWVVWVSAPVDVLMADAAAARRSTLHAALFSLLVSFVVSVVMVLRLRPLYERFREGVEQIASGDFSVRLPKSSRWAPRELVELADAVEQSIERLGVSEARNRELMTRLREVNARQAPLAAVWSQIGDAVELLDSEGRTRFVNPAHEALLGVTGSDLYGQLSSLFSGEDVPVDGTPLSWVETRRALVAGRSVEASLQRRVGDRPLLIGVVISPVFDEAGALDQIAVVRRDLTADRQSQQAKAHNDRLVAVGTMAAGLAHEINSPLSCVRTGLEDLVTDAERGGESLSGEERRAIASDALLGVGQVELFVRRLLQLSRDGEGAEQEVQHEVDLVQVVAASISLSQQRLPSIARVRTELPSVLTTWGNQAELTQCLVNLLVNAGQALESVGPGAPPIQVSGGRSPDGQLVYVDVVDKGCGIPPALLSRIFDPFFTTRDVGVGAGLGLSISRSIVRAHRGDLEACSSPEEGTIFRLTLPWREPAPQTQEPPAQAIKQRPILLVDDDVLVARSLARMLGRSRVSVAHSVDDAISLINQSPGFDVIISDVRMPGRTGVDLHRYLRTHHEELARRLIFITGGTGEGLLSEQLAETGRPLLSKPVRRAILHQAMKPYLRSDPTGAPARPKGRPPGQRASLQHPVGEA